METLLVTGGAGFIGCNFVRLVLAERTAEVVVVDKLTYAGNLQSLADVANDPRFHFAQVDIADRPALERVFRIAATAPQRPPVPPGCWEIVSPCARRADEGARRTRQEDR